MPAESECNSRDSLFRIPFQRYQLIGNAFPGIPADWECHSRDTSWFKMAFQDTSWFRMSFQGYQLIQKVIPGIPADSDCYSKSFKFFYFYLFIKIGVNSTVSIYLAAGLWIRIRMDPQSFSLLDPENARKLVIIGFYYIFYSQLDKLHIFCTLITFSYLTTPENSS